ncbi:MAG: hypothetical protein M1829_001478 [Trizodia sp. TS-e1964]|nr:MAG: hypothetical protein M1829_001478 [Trizodia sp. TS-e1964]
MALLQEPPDAPPITPPAPTPTTDPLARPRRPNLFRIIVDACKADSVALISYALSIISSPDPREIEQETLRMAVRTSLSRNACKVLTLLLEHGAKVPDDSNLSLVQGPTIEVLEILLAHGWDINARGASRQPFLWDVAHDDELVAFGITHGATVIPKDLQLPSENERLNDSFHCPPILDIAAKVSTIATFELLRSLGAPYGPRMLQMAVLGAVNSRSAGERGGEGTESGLLDKDLASLPSERMAMVIHIVDVLGVCPNALDQPAGAALGNHFGYPLLYLLRSSPNTDYTEVLQFLLQRGADPGIRLHPPGWNAIDCAKQDKHQRFLDIVESWKLQKKEAATPAPTLATSELDSLETG